MKYVLCLAIVCVSMNFLVGCTSLLPVGNHSVEVMATGDARVTVNTNETGGPTTSDALNPTIPASVIP